MVNYPKELLVLVQEYLTDGVITAKERQVLINKATALGVNPDEFDLYIDAQVQKLQNAAADIAKQQKGKVCPFCQASVSMFDDKCPACGNYITPEATKEVEELIKTLEKEFVKFKATAADRAGHSYKEEDYAKRKTILEGHVRKAKMYYANNKTIKFLVEEVENSIADSDKSIAIADKKEKRTTFLMCIPGAILVIAFWWWVIKKMFM